MALNSVHTLHTSICIRVILVVRLFCGLLDGVLYLVGKGYMHGDLKPGNVLVNLGADARWMVADFGYSAGSTQLTVVPPMS